MGESKIRKDSNDESRLNFIVQLLDDIKALEWMLEHDKIERGISRIGAEQEFCLITDHWRPAKNADILLKEINDPHFTTELGLFNLEINLDPIELKGNAFMRMEAQLNALLQKASDTAAKHDTHVLLTGILPTISKNELQLEYMTPNPRYYALNDIIKKQRGQNIRLFLTGVDELSIEHDSVLFEACNTSFQCHLQIDPGDFISSYNWAQAIAGPVLGVCVNSPLLLGRELWAETRIALFQQSIDTRSSSYALKEQQSRVSFGNSWAQGTIADLYKNEISRYKVLLERDIEQNALEELQKGNAPKLQALSLHNGTIYKWNRACYGLGGGKAHLRIENRYIPSGPSIIDEIANFALWAGIMLGRPKDFDDLPSVMDFRDAKSNFIKAARTGKESVMNWKGKLISVRDLMLNELLPMAYEGLKKAEVDQSDTERLLGIIEQRTIKGTGAQWNVRNYRRLSDHMKRDEALLALTKSMYLNQQENIPVHNWSEADTDTEVHEQSRLVSHIMSTQLFTVLDNDLARLATEVMMWKNIHHLPVEDEQGQLCGLLTWSHLQHFDPTGERQDHRNVSDIMVRNLITATPELGIEEAKALMQKHSIGCLPVVQDGQLVGIITQKDILEFQHD